MGVFRRFYRTSHITTITVLAALLIGLASPASFASPLDEKKAQLSDIEAKLQANRSKQSAVDRRMLETVQKVRDNDREIARLQTELGGLETQLTETVAKRQAAEALLIEITSRLETAQAELVELQDRLAKRREIYNNRLVGLYKTGRFKAFDVLVSSKSFTDFVERAVFVGKIAESDSRLVQQLRDLEQQATEKVAQIETEQQAAEAQRQAIIAEENRIQAVKKEMIAKQAEFQAELTRQQALLAQVRSEKLELEETEDVLEASSGMVAKQIRSLQSAAAAASRGSSRSSGGAPGAGPSGKGAAGAGASTLSDIGSGFTWPVTGPITSRYGWRLHPVLKYWRLHAGTDFGVVTGTPVHASKGGTVIIAGWRGGYGNTVVIDHGGGLSTLYAHNSSLAVSPGQQVGQGQVIAHSGSTGLSTGPHVHFELRKNGTPVDPLDAL